LKAFAGPPVVLEFFLRSNPSGAERRALAIGFPNGQEMRLYSSCGEVWFTTSDRFEGNFPRALGSGFKLRKARQVYPGDSQVSLR